MNPIVTDVCLSIAIQASHDQLLVYEWCGCHHKVDYSRE